MALVPVSFCTGIVLVAQKRCSTWILQVFIIYFGLNPHFWFSTAFFHENWKKFLHRGGRNAAIGVDRTSANGWSAPPCSCGSSVQPSCRPRSLIWCRSILMTAQRARSRSSLKSHKTWPTSPSEFLFYFKRKVSYSPLHSLRFIWLDVLHYS